jgi:hypothetical protein
MTSEPFTLHVALFPSLSAIVMSDGGDMLVTQIRGAYSKTLSKDQQVPKSKIIKNLLTNFNKFAIIDWKVEQTGKPIPLKEILRDLKLSGIPDIIIEKITFAISWTQYNNYTMQNEEIMKPWSFKPYTFRKGIWKRLKALENFPAKRLYEKYRSAKEALVEDLDEATRKRWRDTILLNEPHPELDNGEIRSMWMGKKFALILKESRGHFDLMDIGEWRA